MADGFPYRKISVITFPLSGCRAKAAGFLICRVDELRQTDFSVERRGNYGGYLTTTRKKYIILKFSGTFAGFSCTISVYYITANLAVQNA
jgi:hypothetical protein